MKPRRAMRDASRCWVPRSSNRRGRPGSTRIRWRWIYPRPGPSRVLRRSAGMGDGGAPGIPWSGSRRWLCALSPGRPVRTRIGREPARCSIGSSTCCVRAWRGAARRRSPDCLPGSKAVGFRPAPPVRRAATGRNFYSIDTRAIPTQAAWQLGWKSAALLLERHAQEYGSYPARIALSAWGTANMRTGGDDVAQALALMGVQPVWEPSSGRVTGFEILPASVLDRPRVDVTLRVSGFFRDAFPGLIDLVDAAARAVAALDEPPGINPLAARVTADRGALVSQGVRPEEAERRAGYRVFGSKPGAYGAGLQTLIDERIWQEEGDLVDAYLGWSGYAYGAGAEGSPERAMLEARLSAV